MIYSMNLLYDRTYAERLIIFRIGQKYLDQAMDGQMTSVSSGAR